MRATFSERVERARMVRAHVPAAIPAVSAHGDPWGMFFLATNDGVRLKVLATNGRMADGEVYAKAPWEHVSVSNEARCPTWEEMCWIKSLFWEDEEVVVQFHPAKSEYVNYHPFCLHLWKPIGFELPTPPAIAVGPR